MRFKRFLKNRPTSVDIDSLLADARHVRSFSDRDRKEFLDWFASAEFDCSNLYLSERLSTVVGLLPSDTAKMLLELYKSKQWDDWKAGAFLRCASVDYCLEGLEALAQRCEASDVHQVSWIGKDLIQNMCSATGQLKKILDRYLAIFTADSYTLYLPSTPPIGNFQLYLQRGIRYPEALHGAFLSRDLAGVKEVETHGDKNAKSAKTQLEHASHLYGNFYAREAIVSKLKVTATSPGHSRFAVFFNFRRDRGADFSREIEELKNDMEPHLAGVLDDAEFTDRDYQIEGILCNQDTYHQPELAGVLDHAAANCLKAFGLSDANSIATISLYNAKLGTHSIAAKTRPVTSRESRNEPVALLDGRGIASWVATKRRSFFTGDIQASAYREFHIELLCETRSVLAVPLISGHELLGVICIESEIPFVFADVDLRIMWNFSRFLADQIRPRQIVIRNFGRIREVLDSYRPIAKTQSRPQRLMEIAKLAKENLLVDHSDVWSLDENGDFCEERGTTLVDLDLRIQPRPKGEGWTHYIATVKFPVFVEVEAEGCRAFALLDECWAPIPRDDNRTDQSGIPPGPIDVNPGIRGLVACELGIPIFASGEVVGVLWLKHKAIQPKPVADDIFLPRYFAEISGEFAI